MASTQLSHVLAPAICHFQVPEDYAVGTLRLSTGRHTTSSEVDQAIKLLLGEMGHLLTGQ
jgi:cysteine sulfinate desulfinase/cysteine desulfurase-like protein